MTFQKDKPRTYPKFSQASWELLRDNYNSNCPNMRPFILPASVANFVLDCSAFAGNRIPIPQHTHSVKRSIRIYYFCGTDENGRHMETGCDVVLQEMITAEIDRLEESDIASKNKSKSKAGTKKKKADKD